MITAVRQTRHPLTYPLPWNTTSTYAGVVYVIRFYDYAGQDPINNYDLNGTCYNLKSYSFRDYNLYVAGPRAELCKLVVELITACANNTGSLNGCAEKAAHEACGRFTKKTRGCLSTIWRPEQLRGAGPTDWVGLLCGVSTAGIFTRIVVGAAVGTAEGLAEVGCQILTHVGGDQGPTK